MDAGGLIFAAMVAAVAGTILGALSGLIPGLHVNSTALLLVAVQVPLTAGFATALAGWGPGPDDLAILVSAMIVALVVAHVMVSMVPAVFLGAPAPETALSVLPGHRLLLEGRGLEAVRLGAWGALAGTIVTICALVPLRFLMGTPLDAYDRVRPGIPFLLFGLVAFLILTETPPSRISGGAIGPLAGRYPDSSLLASAARGQRAKAGGVFALSGGFGFLLLGVPGMATAPLLLTIPTLPGSSVLFPLFAGLFGIPGLLMAD